MLMLKFFVFSNISKITDFTPKNDKIITAGNLIFFLMNSIFLICQILTQMLFGKNFCKNHDANVTSRCDMFFFNRLKFGLEFFHSNLYHVSNNWSKARNFCLKNWVYRNEFSKVFSVTSKKPRTLHYFVVKHQYY